MVAMLLADRYHIGLASTSVTILVGGGSLAGVYLAWVAYRDSQRTEESSTREAITNELATAVVDQWEREVEARRLNDPYPLPIGWTPAEHLSGEWNALVALATNGVGWPASTKTWATGPSVLEGSGNQLANILDQVPTGRLVVLGEPGSGKSMLMVRLVLDLLKRRSHGDAVPVLLSTASWNPMTQGFYSWLTSQLLIAYPALSTPYLSSDMRSSRVEALLQARLIMLLLDGFDELPEELRSRAIEAMNAELRPGERLVITSRTEEYVTATRPAEGAEITLAAAVIELRPLHLQDSRDYLRKSAGGPRSASRWDPVFIQLSHSRNLSHVLTNPLMLGMARAIYNPRLDEQTTSLPDPADLCKFSSKESIEGHLLDAFIPASYRTINASGETPLEGKAQQAEKWLTFLASHLEDVACQPGFSWWDLNSASPKLVYLLTGAAAGLMAGIPLAVIPLLLVVTSAIRVRLATTPVSSDNFFNVLNFVFQQYWERIAELTILFGAAGAITGLAVAINPNRRSAVRGFTLFRRNWHTSHAKLFFALFYALLYALVIYEYESWPSYINILIAIAVGLCAGWLSGNDGFRKATVAAVTVGATVGAPFFLYKNLSWTEDTIVGLPFSLSIGLPVGLAAGAAQLRAQNGRYPSRSIRWNPRRGTIVGVVLGVAIGVSTAFSTGQTSVALVFGCAVGVGAAVIAGLERVPGNLEASVSPVLVLKRDRDSMVALCFVTATVASLAVGFATFALSRSELLPDISPIADAAIFGPTIGLTCALIFGFFLSGYGSAWPQWAFARQILAVRRKTPNRLMAFLEDCHKRGILRQVGPIYYFRHIELQHRLASRMPRKKSPAQAQQITVATTWQQRPSALRPFTPSDERLARRIRFAVQVISTAAALTLVSAILIGYSHAIIARENANGRPSSSLVPVVECPANYGVPEGISSAQSSGTKSAPVSSVSGRKLAYYTDTMRFIPTILGPRGWKCSAGVGADGGWSINIYPKGASSNGPMGIHANGPACALCVLDVVCPLIPHAAMELSYQEQCSLARIPKQIVSWMVGSPKFSSSGNDVVRVVDPPGVKGFLAHSGGLYADSGVLLYFWGAPVYYFGYPSGRGASAAMTISCILPNSDLFLCNSILTTFSQRGWTGG